MSRNTKHRLSAIQLQQWVNAFKTEKTLTITDSQTKQKRELNLPFAISDGDGLTFTFSKAGKASWILRYRHGGRARELTIGGYP